MVVTETLQVILNAKDQLTSKINEVNNALRQTGTAANTASSSATSATSRLGNAYTQLQNKVRTVFNNIKTTIRNSTAGKIVSESSLAQPFLNVAEKIRQKWTSMTENLKSKMQSLKGGANTDVGFNISPAGLATLNGQVTTTTGKVTALGNVMNRIASGASKLGINFGTAFTTASSKIEGFKTKLSTAKDKITNLASGLSGVQSAVMGAFAMVGVTSLKSFTIEAAIAREKVNAVTKSVTGSEAAFTKTQKSIKTAIAGTTLGYNNMATAVNNVALRFHLTGDAVSNLAGPMAKVGIMAQAMGKSSSEAASIMEHAFDGLQGKWKSLKQIGITEADLKAAGWSGAANDVNGYAAALDKVLEKNPKFKEFTNTFEYQWESFKMTIKGVGTEIGMTLLPILKSFLSMLTDLSKSHPWLIKIAVVIGVVVLALASIATVLLPIIQLIEIIKTLTIVTTIWNAVMAMNPITIIVIAIIALIAILWYLYNTNEEVRAAIDGFIQFIWGSVGPAWDYLCGCVGNAWGWLMGLGEWLSTTFTDAWNGIVGFFEWLGSIFTNFGSYLELMYNNFVTWLWGIVIYVWTWAVNVYNGFILAGYQAVWGFLLWIASLPGQFWNYLVMCWNNFLNWAGQMIAKASEAGNRVVTDFINWITSLPGKFWNWLLNTINKIKDFKDQAVQKMKDTAKKMVDDFIEYVKKLPSKFGEWLGKIKDEIWARRGALVSAIIRLGWDLLREFKNALLGSVFGSAEVGGFNRMVYDGLSGAGSVASRAGYLVGNSFNAGVLDGMDKAGLDNIGISGNGQVLASVEHEISTRQGDSQTQLLRDIKDALGSLRVEHTGSIDFNQNVDVTGDTGLTEEELRSAVMQALQDRNVLKQIVQSREFQSMDKRMKNRMIQEMSRHI